MALNKTQLEQAIKAAMDKQAAKESETDDPETARQEFAKDLAQAIYDFIIQAQVNTTVTGTAGPYPVTGTGTGALN